MRPFIRIVSGVGTSRFKRRPRPASTAFCRADDIGSVPLRDINTYGNVVAEAGFGVTPLTIGKLVLGYRLWAGITQEAHAHRRRALDLYRNGRPQRAETADT
jgi:hypothetical protein